MALSTPSAAGPRLALEVEDLGGSLESAQYRLAAFLVSAGVGSRPAYRANLVFEELATNILKYGGDEGAPPRADCSVTLEPEELVLVFRDRGRPFDPTSAPERRRPASIAEAEVGGLGLDLVRKVATAIDYRREAAENVTRVRLALVPD